jgi:hypothetical protein
MPQFARALDVVQGFNFKKDKQGPVGFVTSITIGGTVLNADLQTIKDPEKPGDNLSGNVVAVLNHYLWETGATDAIYLSGQVSTGNKQLLASMLLGTFSSIEVLVKYVVYEYDPLAKKYFKSNFLDAELKGLLEKSGDDLNLSIADDESREVQSPKNFTFQIGIKPQATEQSINVATADAKNIAKKWGVTDAS